MLTEGKELRGVASDYHGPPLELILASGSVYPQTGRVRFANNQVDVKTGTIRVVGEFPNPQGLLLPGMFVRVRALLDTENERFAGAPEGGGGHAGPQFDRHRRRGQQGQHPARHRRRTGRAS